MPPVVIPKPLREKVHKHMLFPQGPAGISGRPGAKVRGLLRMLLVVFVY